MYIHSYDVLLSNGDDVDHLTLDIRGNSVILLDREGRRNKDLLNLMAANFSNFFRNTNVNLWINFEGINFTSFNRRNLVRDSLLVKDGDLEYFSYLNSNIRKDHYTAIVKALEKDEIIFRYIRSIYPYYLSNMDRNDLRGLRSRLSMADDLFSRALDISIEYPYEFLVGHLKRYNQISGFFFINKIEASPFKKQEILKGIMDHFPNVQLIIADDDPFILQMMPSSSIIDVTGIPKFVDGIQTFDASIEDICENVLGSKVPQRSIHFLQFKKMVEEGRDISEIKEKCWRYVDIVKEYFK